MDNSKDKKVNPAKSRLQIILGLLSLVCTEFSPFRTVQNRLKKTVDLRNALAQVLKRLTELDLKLEKNADPNLAFEIAACKQDETKIRVKLVRAEDKLLQAEFDWYIASCRADPSKVRERIDLIAGLKKDFAYEMTKPFTSKELSERLSRKTQLCDKTVQKLISFSNGSV
jgi:hypothetical protein